MRLRSILLWLLVLALLGPAALLTTVRLVEPSGGTWIRAVAFTPLAIPAYAMVVALFLICAALPGVRRRRLWVGSVLVVVGPLALHGWWFAPQLVGGDDTAPLPDTQGVTVMTANLLAGAGDGTAVLEEAVGQNVDVLVLQEITPGGLASMEDAGLAAAYPFRAGEPAPGTAGTMILATGPVTDVDRLPTGLGGWVATVDLDGSQVRVLGVHPRPPIGDAALWAEDHEAVLAAAQVALAGDLPVLLAGDLNATPDHRPVRALADAGLVSVAERADQGWLPTWPAGVAVARFPSFTPPLVQIDHVLIDDRFAALYAETVSIPGSDHLGVVAGVVVR